MAPVLSTLGGASQFGFGRSAKITIQKPIIEIDPGSISGGVTKTKPTFNGSAFIFSNGTATTTHGSSDWQFSTASDFSSLISPQSITDSSTNKTSYTITTKFPYSTLIYARVRYKDNASPANISDWSVPINFTTQAQPFIATPTILTPTQNSLSETRQITITTSNFSISGDEDGETHQSTTYQVSDVSDFSSTVYNVTSTSNKITITTTDVGGGTKYIRVKHNGSLGVALSDWSATRTMTTAWAATGAGVGTYYPDSDSYVVTPSNSGTVNLSSGQYRIHLWGAGGGAADGGGNGPRRGGYAGGVIKDIYLSSPSSISISLGGGGGGTSLGNNGASNGVNGGGSNGGGAGGDGYWAGAGGGGYSSATFGGVTMYAAAGGGAAGDGMAEGRSARKGLGGDTGEWYGDSGPNKLIRKGTGVGGIAPKYASGSSSSSQYAGGGGASMGNGDSQTERIVYGGGAYSDIRAYVSFRSETFTEGSTTTTYRTWSGDNTSDVDYYLQDYNQAGGGNSTVRPNAWVSDNFKKFNVTDMWGNNDDGPYQDLDSSFNVTVAVGFFYNDQRFDGVGTSNDDLDHASFKYYHTNEFCAGDGGSNGGSFGNSYASDYGVGNSYYYAAGGYTFGDAGTSTNGWNGKPGGARIQRITQQVTPNVIISAQPSSSYTANAGDWFNVTCTAYDANNASSIVEYQWEISTNGGSTWSDIPGGRNSTLKRFDRCYYSDNGHKVRCKCSVNNGQGGGSTVYSNVATININRRNYERVDPILPYATYYNYPGTARLASFTQDGVYADTNNWSTNSSHYRTIRDIPSGYGKIRVKWNTVIAGEKDFGPTGGSGCSNGYGTNYTYELRLAVLRLSDNAILWSSHDRSFNLRNDMRDDPSNDSGRVLQNWDFDNTIDVDPDSTCRLIIQYKSNTYERCDCSGGNPPTSFSNCFNTGQYARFRVQFRSPGYYSRTKVLYGYDTRPGVGYFTYG